MQEAKSEGKESTPTLNFQEKYQKLKKILITQIISLRMKRAGKMIERM